LRFDNYMIRWSGPSQPLGGEKLFKVQVCTVDPEVAPKAKPTAICEFPRRCTATQKFVENMIKERHPQVTSTKIAGKFLFVYLKKGAMKSQEVVLNSIKKTAERAYQAFLDRRSFVTSTKQVAPSKDRYHRRRQLKRPAQLT